MFQPSAKVETARFLKIGVTFPYFIAPMVGISHVAFRELIRFYTPPSVFPLIFSEMLSSLRLPVEKLGEVDSLCTATGESGLIPQLLCNAEEPIAASLERLRWVRPWGVDINMGCPVTQTLKHNWGVQLMHDPKQAATVVGYARKHTHLPLSVKLRAALGRDFDQKYLLEFTAALEAAGADWLTVHCRTAEQKHNGLANWEMVQAVAEARKIPVVANGDIHTWEDALKVKSVFGVDGVMIARAATARPWILWQIAWALDLPGVRSSSRQPPFTPDEEGREYFASLLRLSCQLEDYYGDTPAALKRMLFHLGLGCRWLFFGHDFWLKARRQATLWQLRDFINEYREASPQHLARVART